MSIRFFESALATTLPSSSSQSPERLDFGDTFALISPCDELLTTFFRPKLGWLPGLTRSQVTEEKNVCNRAVIGAVLGTALLLVGFVTPAAAQTPGATVGVGLSFLSVPDETGVGFTADVAKEFAVMGKAAIAGVGDFSFHDFDGFSETTFGGGVRVIGKAQKAQFFGQVLFGGLSESVSDTL